MISFARATSVTPGQLHQNLVVLAVPGDDRLGHAQLVDAPLDRLQRLRDRFLAQLTGDVRPHREGVAAGAGRAVEDQLDVGEQLPKRRVLVGRHALDAELGRAGHA